MAFSIALSALILLAIFATLASAMSGMGGVTPIFERPGGPELLSRAVSLSNRVANSSCRTDVCFALAGGGAGLTSGDFRAQLEFAQLVSLVAGADPSAHFGAAQAAGRVLPVSNLTNADALVVRLGDTKFARADRAFPAPAVLFCARLLRAQGTAGNDAQIVLFTGPDAPFRPNTLDAVKRSAMANTTLLAATVGLGRPELKMEASGGPEVTTAPDDVATRVNITIGANLATALTTAVEFLCAL